MRLSADLATRHRRESRIAVGLLVAAFLVWGLVYIAQRQARQAIPGTMTTTVVLFVLWWIDLILIVAVLFVIFRALFKLLLERRRGVLGSRLKTKLLVTYIGLTAIPVGLIFVAATDLIQRTVDRWFAIPVQQVMDRARRVNDQAINRLGEAARNEARALAGSLPAEPRGVVAALREEAELRRVASVEWYAPKAPPWRHVALPSAADAPPTLTGAELEALVAKEEWPRIDVAPSGAHWIRAAARGPAGTVVVGQLLPPAEARASEFLANAWSDYKKFEVEKPIIKASNLLTFLLLTLAILFAATWIGLTLARRITVPIQALAESTRRIAEGDLSARVEAPALDELGVLVDSFNAMTADLRANKDALLQSNTDLSEANRLLSAVLRTVRTGIIAFEADRRVAVCNPAVREILGIPGEPANLEEWRVVAGLAPLVALLDDYARCAAALARELTLERNGQTRRVEASVAPMQAPATGSLLALEDTTEIARAQKLEAWSEVARRVAHEIKNPLTPIRLSAERMARKMRAADPTATRAVEEGTRLIVEEVELLKSLVDEFSRFARMPETRPMETDLAALAERVIRLYQGAGDGARLMLVNRLTRHQFRLDPDQIQRALSNLIENALEASGPGGEIRVLLSESDDTVSIEVADNGRGLPRADRDKLFLPDFSTKGQGSGLGLAIVQRIVADHHGTIRCEDNKPRGARFIIELPA